MELIYLLFSCPQLCAHNCVWHLNCVRQCALTIATQDNPADLWQLRHWLQFLQLRTWIHDNLCYLTIKSDSGQHSQFLRCFRMFVAWVSQISHVLVELSDLQWVFQLPVHHALKKLWIIMICHNDHLGFHFPNSELFQMKIFGHFAVSFLINICVILQAMCNFTGNV